MAYDFKYIRTGTGELSGPSMIWQTEQALTQIGTYADEANTKADEALETANTALNKANEAAEAAERAQNTADAAQAAANRAQETADAAQVAADNAQDTADEALETAQKGVADAAKAQAAADKAQASADAAQDAADAAQLTADNAQNTADKAQDAANTAQQTANKALNAASNSQGSANVAQDTADNALLVAQATQQAFYEHVREYTPQIAKALGEFEADNTTVNFDNFTDSVKLYITSPNASITGPNGKVNSPFYLWNFTTDDRSSTAQFVYAANGLTYSRYGTIGQNDLVPGTDTYTLENNKKNAILTCKGVASGMTITKSGSLTNTWTASDTHDSYIAGTWNIKGITNGTIDLNGVTIANLSNTGFYPTGQQQLQEDNTSFVIEDMTYSADNGLTIKVAVRWLNIDSRISWHSWKVDTPAVDNVTIKYNSSNELQAKDIAINGDESDLASARGQIGNGTYRTVTNTTDFNDYIESGIYKLAWNTSSIPQNAPTWGTSGALVVYATKTTGGDLRVKQQWLRYETYSFLQRHCVGTTWSAWSFIITNKQLGDGIKIAADKISIPEMDGASASANGASGLVPAPAKEDFNKGGALLASGDWGYPEDVLASDSDQTDTAKTRGFIVGTTQPWYAGTAAATYDITNFDDFTRPGLYHIRWREGTDADDENPVTANNPNLGKGGASWFDGTIEIRQITSATSVSSYRRYMQEVTSYVTAVNTPGAVNSSGLQCVKARREYINATSNPYWTKWRQVPFEDQFGPGRIGDAEVLTNPNFNTITVPGEYRITGSPTNGPSLSGISGASIGVLQVSGEQGNGNRIFQTMMSANAILWRTSTDDGGSWSAWQQIITSNAIGNGITNTGGKFSVANYKGASASAAGTAGLVPPAGKGQQARFLRADGSWVDIDSGEGTYLPIAGGSMSGNISYAATSTAGDAITIKAMTKGLVYVTPSANTTISFSMPSNLRGGIVVVLILIDGGSKTITWGSNVIWANGEVPELTADGTDILTFFFEKVVDNLKVVGVLSAKDVK